MAINHDRHYFLLKKCKTEHLYFNYQQKNTNIDMLKTLITIVKH